MWPARCTAVFRVGSFSLCCHAIVPALSPWVAEKNYTRHHPINAAISMESPMCPFVFDKLWTTRHRGDPVAPIVPQVACAVLLQVA